MKAAIASLATSRFRPILTDTSCSVAMRFQIVLGEQLRTHAASGTVNTLRLGAGSTATTGFLIRLPTFRRLVGGLLIGRDGLANALYQSGSQSGPLIQCKSISMVTNNPQTDPQGVGGPLNTWQQINTL